MGNEETYKEDLHKRKASTPTSHTAWRTRNSCAAQILRELLASAADSGRAFDVASTYAGLGDFDRAFFWLNRSFDDYSFSRFVTGPLFDDLRADPRFNAIRRRLGTEKR